MDHEYAVEKHAVEQYLLGELNSRERDEFEEHFFSCPECAEAVRTGAYFADNTKSALKDKAARPTVPGERPSRVVEMNARHQATLWHRLSPPVGIAAALLLGVVGYQNLIAIPAMLDPKPRMLARTVLRPVSRGEEAEVVRKPGNKLVVLDMDVNSEKTFPYYRVDVETQSGRPVTQVTGEAPADGALEIELPSSLLPPDHYVLKVRGQSDESQPGPEIAGSRFFVRQ